MDLGRLRTMEAASYATKYSTGNMSKSSDGMFRARCVTALATSIGAMLFNCVAYTIATLAKSKFAADYDTRSTKNMGEVQAYAIAIFNPLEGLTKLGGRNGNKLGK